MNQFGRSRQIFHVHHSTLVQIETSCLHYWKCKLTRSIGALVLLMDTIKWRRCDGVKTILNIRDHGESQIVNAISTNSIWPLCNPSSLYFYHSSWISSFFLPSLTPRHFLDSSMNYFIRRKTYKFELIENVLFLESQGLFSVYLL